MKKGLFISGIILLIFWLAIFIPIGWMLINSPSVEGKSKILKFILLIFNPFSIIGVIFLIISFKNKENVKKKNNSKNLKGISGWLLFFVIILIFELLYLLIETILFYQQTNYLKIIDTIISSILLLVSLVFIFKNSRFAPKLTIATFWISFLTGILFDFLSKNINVALYFFAFIESIILTIYFLKSKRVKNTFVN
ncbi:DUF2569 family protein [Candidatus Pacearchaeota archaeon]|nr:DUF2569 family protein [Candidatus Pacearchaeota archaeon]